MRVSHALPMTAAASPITFGDPNLIAHPGLHDQLSTHLTLAGPGSANAAAKATALIAGMLTGADSIDDMDVMRYGANTKLFDGVRDQLVCVDVDDTIQQTYGYAEQASGYGYSKVKGLNAMLVTATTPTSPPVIVGTRLRKGSVASAKGAPKPLGDALATLERTGTAPVLVRLPVAGW